MELFSLLAKLTLDSKDYKEGIDEAQKLANGLDIPEPELKIKTDGFDDGIEKAKTGTDEVKDSLTQANEEGSLFGQVMTGVWEGIRDAIVTTSVVGLISSFVGYLRESIALAGKNGQAINDQAHSMSMSTKAYQEWDYALKMSGSSIKDLTDGMKNFEKIKAGDITDDQAGYFEKLGIDVEDASYKMLSAEQMMSHMLYTLADYEGDDRGLIARAFFGDKKGANLFQLLDSTSTDIKQLQKQASDLGIVMTDEEIQNAVDYNNTITKFNETLEGLKESLGASILPMLTSASKEITKIVLALTSTPDKSLVELFAGDDKEFAKELLTIEGTSSAAQTLADKLLAMGDTSEMTAQQYEIWKGTAERLIELVPTLGDVIDTESGQIKANSDEIKENIKQWENLAKQKALQTLKEQKYQQIVQKNQDLIDKSIEANDKAADAESKRAEALENFNNVLKAYGFDELGEGSTLEDIRKAQTSATLGFVGDEQSLATFTAALSSAFSELSSADAKANEAQAQAEALAKDLEEGEKEYQDWLAAAEQLYGTLEGDAESATADVDKLRMSLESLPHEVRIGVSMQSLTPYATGSAYIPFDQPAFLHRGEQVLTARKVRQKESRTDLAGLEDRIEAAIRAGMENATVNSYINGRSVTDDVNRDQVRRLKSRRFAP